MKEIKYFCDDRNCKKELLWSENYFIVEIETHVANMSYTGNSPLQKHYCKNCFEKRY